MGSDEETPPAVSRKPQNFQADGWRGDRSREQTRSTRYSVDLLNAWAMTAKLALYYCGRAPVRARRFKRDQIGRIRSA